MWLAVAPLRFVPRVFSCPFGQIICVASVLLRGVERFNTQRSYLTLGSSLSLLARIAVFKLHANRLPARFMLRQCLRGAHKSR